MLAAGDPRMPGGGSKLSEVIEAAVGKAITGVRVDSTNHLVVDITLDDGKVLHLVQPPADPADPSGRTRS